MTTSTQDTSILFVAMTVPEAVRTDEQGEVLLHSGYGNPFLPTDSYGKKMGYWHSYLGVGSLLSVGNATNSTNTSSNEFSIGLAIPEPIRQDQASINLLQAAAYSNLEDENVTVHALEYVALGQIKEPTLLLIARVGNISINDRQITLGCYTAAAQLDKVHKKPTVWNDYQQKQRVDEDDWGFRFSNLTGEEAQLNFP